MKDFFSPPPLVEKLPRRPLFGDVGKLERRSVIFVLVVSAFGMATLFTVVGILLVIFIIWPLYRYSALAEALSAMILAVLFVSGFLLGTWSGRFLVWELGGKTRSALEKT